MNKAFRNLVAIIIIILLVTGAVIRVFLYGDLRLSIGTRDTSSYISSSDVPLFSWEMFTGSRLFTTNLVYRMANGRECDLTTVSKPAEGNEEFRAVQPCFDRIALLQNILAILSWCIFAWVFSRRLRNPYTKITAVVLILLFAFAPQIAEWDSVLGSESLTLSLLALSLALLLEILFRISDERQNVHVRTKLLIGVYLFVFALWVLTRDVNLFAVPITVAMVLILFLSKSFRWAKYLIAIASILICLLVIGIVSTKQSTRLDQTLGHSFDVYIFPYPTRVGFFKKFGVPDRQSPDYIQWQRDKGSTAYGLFLVMHPGFVASTIFDNINYFTDAYTQQYYKSPEIPYRDSLVTIGELVHPKSSAVYLMDTLLVLTMGLAAIKHRKPNFFAWAWFAVWLYLTSAVTLFLNFFGDLSGVLRHIFPPVATFRLTLWLFLLILIDLILEQKEAESISE